MLSENSLVSHKKKIIFFSIRRRKITRRKKTKVHCTEPNKVDDENVTGIKMKKT